MPIASSLPAQRVRNERARVQAETDKRSVVTAPMKSMKAIVVTDQAAGTAGMKLVERPRPPAAINDVIVQIYASVSSFRDGAKRRARNPER